MERGTNNHLISWHWLLVSNFMVSITLVFSQKITILEELMLANFSINFKLTDPANKDTTSKKMLYNTIYVNWK